MERKFADRSLPPSVAAKAADTAEAALIARVAAASDLPAFEALYRAYHPRLIRFVGLMVSRRPVVEEILNDTMLVVWRRAHTYNGQCKVSTWVFAIAYRTALKALRQQDTPVEGSALDDRATDERGPEQRHSDRQTRAALEQALAALSAEQRSVLVLTYFHGLPYTEIAQIVECPPDTVKTRMFHGRRRLRALLSGELRDWL
ncbi:MAG: sigma-70 family RNA polymerase sigma factor [Pseudomonadota bacterium]|nr:sigma-70 family RNA polymerase sigma factor [Pseudomonadota bacterium]MDP9168949.1 sigma-70 family RNA polymerase sigma factor [Actinomycetota bacterium]